MADHYQVRRGDNARSIARALTRDERRWLELKAENPRRDWDRLQVGELLTLPPSWRRPQRDVGIGAVVSSSMTLDEARARTPWLSTRFFTRVPEIASKYGANPTHLLIVMYQESGVHPSANPNPSTGANGLIHWMPENTPRGMTRAQLLAMNAEQQLELVDAWFGSFFKQMNGRPLDSAGKVYATVFCPGRLTPTCNDNTVAFREGEHGKSYTLNKSLDVLEPKGVITFADLGETVRRRGLEASFQKFALRLQLEGGAAPWDGGTGGQGGAGGAGGAVASSGAGRVLKTLGMAAGVAVAVAGAFVVASDR